MRDAPKAMRSHYGPPVHVLRVDDQERDSGRRLRAGRAAPCSCRGKTLNTDTRVVDASHRAAIEALQRTLR